MTDTTVKNNETTQKESDESTSKGDIKHIGYAGLIARRFFRQRSAVVGLIILAGVLRAVRRQHRQVGV